MKTFAIIVGLLFACSVCHESVSVFSRVQAQLAASNIPQRSVGNTTCGVITCVDPGAHCNISTAMCGGFTFCDPARAICTPFVPVGAACDQGSNRCAYDCIEGKCRFDLRSAPGERCATNYDCFVYEKGSEPFGTCVDGRCFGLFIGQACNDTYSPECSNSYCNPKTSLCTAWGVSGSMCSENDKCLEDLVCQNGTCSLPNVVSKGSNCSISFCDSGLYCGHDHICHDASDVTQSPCTDILVSECPNGQTCVCDIVNGESVCFDAPNDYGRARYDYRKCWENNKCNLQNYSTDCDEGVCHADMCSYLLAQIDHLEKFNFGLSPPCLSDLFDNLVQPWLVQSGCKQANNNKFPTWAIVLIVIAGVLVLAILGYFVYSKVSKRSQYSRVN